MENIHIIKQRYLKDDLSTRLGGLAANLSRIKSFFRHDANQNAVENLLNESRFFIEWTARDTEIETAAELVELQIQPARRKHNWASIWKDTEQRHQIAKQASLWSKRILALSSF